MSTTSTSSNPPLSQEQLDRIEKSKKAAMDKLRAAAEAALAAASNIPAATSEGAAGGAADEPGASETAEDQSELGDQGGGKEALSSASASSGVIDCSEILSWCRNISLNLVPPESKYFQPYFPGLLLADTVLPPYKRPFALVWMIDELARSSREQDISLLPHQRTFPALPFWNFSSPGDNECIPRSLLLSHEAPQFDEGSKQLSVAPLHDALIALSRCPFDGVVHKESEAEELRVIAEFRASLSKWLTNFKSAEMSETVGSPFPFQADVSELIASIAKAKQPLLMDQFGPPASVALALSLQVAFVEARVDGWPSDHNLPSGIIHSTALRWFPDRERQLKQCSSNPPLFPNLEFQNMHPHTTLLWFNNSVPGPDKSELGHVEPLIAAPDYLHSGTNLNHPLFPGSSSIMYPITTVPGVGTFLTPFYYGIIGQDRETEINKLLGIASPSTVVAAAASSASAPPAAPTSIPIVAMLRTGTVIKYKSITSGEIVQGVVLQTLIRSSVTDGREFLTAIKNSFNDDESKVAHQGIDRAFPLAVPKSIVLVWPLVEQVGDSLEKAGCWSKISEDCASLLNLPVNHVISIVDSSSAWPRRFPRRGQKIFRFHRQQRKVLQKVVKIPQAEVKEAIPPEENAIILELTRIGVWTILDSWLEEQVKTEINLSKIRFPGISFFQWIHSQGALPFDIESTLAMREFLPHAPPLPSRASLKPAPMDEEVDLTELGDDDRSISTHSSDASPGTLCINCHVDHKKKKCPKAGGRAGSRSQTPTLRGASADSTTIGTSDFEAVSFSSRPGSRRVLQNTLHAAATAAAEQLTHELYEKLSSSTVPERNAPLAAWALQLPSSAKRTLDVAAAFKKLTAADSALSGFLYEQAQEKVSVEELCATLSADSWRRAPNRGAKKVSPVLWLHHEGRRPSSKDRHTADENAERIAEEAEEALAAKTASANLKRKSAAKSSSSAAAAASKKVPPEPIQSAANAALQKEIDNLKKKLAAAAATPAASVASSTAAAAAATSESAAAHSRKRSGRSQQSIIEPPPPLDSADSGSSSGKRMKPEKLDPDPEVLRLKQELDQMKQQQQQFMQQMQQQQLQQQQMQQQRLQQQQVQVTAPVAAAAADVVVPYLPPMQQPQQQVQPQLTQHLIPFPQQQQQQQQQYRQQYSLPQQYHAAAATGPSPATLLAMQMQLQLSQQQSASALATQQQAMLQQMMLQQSAAAAAGPSGPVWSSSMSLSSLMMPPSPPGPPGHQ